MNEHPIFYIAQERAMAPGIVREWPTVFTSRKTPNGRLLKLSHEQVAAELRQAGWKVEEPTPGTPEAK